MSAITDRLYKMAITDLHLEQGRKRQQIPHLLIIKGSWRKLRRPPGYPIRPDLPHARVGGSSHKVVSPKLSPLTGLHRATKVQYVLRRTVYRQLTYLTQQIFRDNVEHPPTSSTQSGDADSRAGNTPHNAINRPSVPSTQSKRKASSIGNAPQTAMNRTPAPSAQSKVRGSSVEDTSSAVTMVEDGSRKVTKVQDLLN